MAIDQTALETAAVVGTTIGAAIGGSIMGRKSAKKEPATGDAQLVMGAMVGPQAVQDLKAAIIGVDGTMRELVELMKAEAHRREVEQAVAAEIERRHRE